MKYIKEYSLFEAELGWKEIVSIPGLGRFVAKLDTGNGTKASSLGVDQWKIDGDSVSWSCNGQDRVDPIVDWSSAEVGDSIDRRPVIILDIEIGPRRLSRIPVALADRSGKETPLLINRDLLSQLGVSVAPDREFTLTETTNIDQARRLLDLGLSSPEDFKQTVRDLGYVERNRTGFITALKELFNRLGLELKDIATPRQQRNGTMVIKMSPADAAEILFTVGEPAHLTDRQRRRWAKIIGRLRPLQRAMEMETGSGPDFRGTFEYWILPGSFRGAGFIGEPTSNPQVTFDGTQSPEELVSHFIYRVALDADARAWRWDSAHQSYRFR